MAKESHKIWQKRPTYCNIVSRVCDVTMMILFISPAPAICIHAVNMFTS